MKWTIAIFLSCASAMAQLPTLMIPNAASSASTRWWPTNATSGSNIWWAETIPMSGVFGGDGTTYPASNNQTVKYWTNFAPAFNGARWTADQSLHPTNFTSGGGGNGTSPRLFFGPQASATRMVSPGAWPTTTNKATVIVVVNCTRTSGIDNIFINPASTPYLRYTSKALEINQGSALTSATTMGTGYYTITAVFAAGVSSRIDTNGVNMVTGTAGTGNMADGYLGNNGTDAIFNGNMCRIWGWSGVLSELDISNAVAQCRLDFGTP